MAVEIKLPELGENVDSGTLARLLVTVGEEIKKDQPLIELETEKAVVEVPASQGGVVSKILVKEGQTIAVGETILWLEAMGESFPEEVPPPAVSQTAEPEAQEEVVKKEPAQKQVVPSTISGEKISRLFSLPEVGENIQTGTVSKIFVTVGEAVDKGQNVLELETEKAVIEIPLEFSGTIKNILIKEGDVVRVGQNIFEIVTSAETVPSPKTSEQFQPEPEKPAKNAVPAIAAVTQPLLSSRPETTEVVGGSTVSLEPAAAAPSVRRFAREIGININEVTGSGPGSRISIEDVKNYARIVSSQKVVSGGILKGVEAEKLPDFSRWGEIERQPMSKVREKTARHLSYGWATIPQVTQFDKADISDLEQFRQRYAKSVEAAGGKLTVTVILLKIVAVALKIFPQFNASVDMENFEIIYKKFVNIGVAVDTDRGLLVPVLRQVDKKNLTQLSKELTELAQKARDRKLNLEEMQGSNFSISNLGGIGGTGFSPLVNSPEVAILGVSRSEMQQVFRDGEFKPRLILPLSLSYDHRLIDGADAARFLRWIAEAIEQPFKILLEL